MENEEGYIDFHCHPTLKPFGKSFDSNKSEERGRQSKDITGQSSLWKRDKVKKNQLDRAVNTFTSLTKFRQKSFADVVNSKGRILVLAIGPMEKGLAQTKLTGKSKVSDIFINLVTGVGQNRLNHVQALEEYFSDMEQEVQFLDDCANELVEIDGKSCTYKIINNYNEYEPATENVINLILSFEGAYVFNTGLGTKRRPKKADENEVLNNIRKVKSLDPDEYGIWKYKPFFVTLGHHYDNEICGHHRTYPPAIGFLVGQKIDTNKGFEPLGWKVVDELLTTKNGKRILIDIKHLNMKSRYQFYEYLDSIEWKDDSGQKIPLIYSHGSFNHHNDPSELKGKKRRIKHAEINLFDEEILKVKKSGGIIGLQLDKRRLNSKKSPKFFLFSLIGIPVGLGKGVFKTVRMLVTRDKRLRKRSIKLIWKKLLYAAEYLNKQGEECWSTVCLGTDFDGIINPLNGFWTAKEIPLIAPLLSKEIEKFKRRSPERWKKFEQNGNAEKTETIVHNFMYENARGFLEREFK